MAVYQGARRRGALPLGLDGVAARLDRAGQERSRPVRTSPRAEGGATSGTTTRRRPPTVGIALAAIVLVFGAAFLTLSQSVRVAATGYDIVRLVSEQERLQAIRQDLRSDVNRLRSEPAIRKQALDAGLGQLGAPVIVQAR
jgi:hypothetical protein